MKDYASISFGSSGGETIIGNKVGNKVLFKKIYTWESHILDSESEGFWDLDKLKKSAIDSLIKLKEVSNDAEWVIGINTWGISHVLIDNEFNIIRKPVYHRIKEDNLVREDIQKTLGNLILYEITGLTTKKYNSLFFLYLQFKSNPELKNSTKAFLMLSDYLNYYLTGVISSEETNASTSHLYDISKRNWAWNIIDAFGFPRNIFPLLEKQTLKLGNISSDILSLTGLRRAEVMIAPSHDTSAAVAACAFMSKETLFISSGSRGLVGIESDHPILTEEANMFGLSNEIGVGNKILIQKNITNMWILQCCLNHWKKAGYSYTWRDLISMAEKAMPFVGFINPENEIFLRAENMPSIIINYCRQNKYQIEDSHGSIMRICLESLAYEYRFVKEQIEKLLDIKIKKVQVVGGGASNLLLNQMISDSTNTVVIAGPHDATGYGCILMQMIAKKDIESLVEGRELLKSSLTYKTFKPQNSNIWDENYNKFTRLI